MQYDITYRNMHKPSGSHAPHFHLAITQIQHVTRNYSSTSKTHVIGKAYRKLMVVT